MKKQSNPFGLYKKILLVILVLASGVSYRCSRMEGLTESGNIQRRFESEAAESKTPAKEPAEDAISAKALTTKEPAEDAMTAKALICVHIAGAVKHPGVYFLKKSSRVFEGIEAAGGLSEDADTDALNLAMPMEDAQKIYVPRVGEDLSAVARAMEGAGNSTNAGASDPDLLPESAGQQSVNINTAGLSELVTLPGIGEKRAEDILRYRRDHGKFQSIEEIMNVPGIKQNAFERIKDKIIVGE